MKARVGQLVGGVDRGHALARHLPRALASRILRRHAELVGLKSNFTILDIDDQLRLLRQIVQAAPHRREALAAAAARQPDRRLEEPRAHPRARARLGVERLQPPGRRALRRVPGAAARPERLRLRRPAAARRSRSCRATPTCWRSTSAGSATSSSTSTRTPTSPSTSGCGCSPAGHRNICCVGDDDQSIYGWRGAEVGNILRFEKDFPGAHGDPARAELPLDPAHPRRRLRRDRRQRAAASARRSGPTSPEGEKVRLIGHWDGEEEARWIGEEIEALARGTRGLDPVRPDGIAILVRASYQMRAFEDRFLTIGLPYRVIGGPRFYERQEIRDAMAYFRVAVSPDDDLAFERIVNTPKRGIGDKALQEINRTAREQRRLAARRRRPARRPTAACRRAPAPPSAQLVDGFDRWHAAVRDGRATTWSSPSASSTSSATPTCGTPRSRPTPRAASTTSRSSSRRSASSRTCRASSSTSAWSWRTSTDEGAEKVSVMTLHAAKGLEFPAVFLPGWEDGLFPSQRSMDESGLKGLEEERRLAYVGITRARSASAPSPSPPTAASTTSGSRSSPRASSTSCPPRTSRC